ncbi:hypothetical protein ABZX88_21440 [Kitasatospora aureofaciens]|uniref:hypothetical protein n=1 Tax=Kitasatospora aureofaciens TaxID=1894 RepID=UPI0033B6B665
MPRPGRRGLAQWPLAGAAAENRPPEFGDLPNLFPTHTPDTLDAELTAVLERLRAVSPTQLAPVSPPRSSPCGRRRHPHPTHPTLHAESFDAALTTPAARTSSFTSPGAPHNFFEQSAVDHAEAARDARNRLWAFLDAAAQNDTGYGFRPGDDTRAEAWDTSAFRTTSGLGEVHAM